MQKRLIELGEQRGRLRERIAYQRLTLAREVQPLIAPLSLPARVATWVRQGKAFVFGHPYVLGTTALALRGPEARALSCAGPSAAAGVAHLAQRAGDGRPDCSTPCSGLTLQTSGLARGRQRVPVPDAGSRRARSRRWPGCPRPGGCS
jgi:hypothetical protein